MNVADRRSAPEIWGGVECTINRVGDHYHDQLRRSKHLERLEDVDRFAELGLKALRVPLLWERSCPSGPKPSFAWVEPLLQRVRANQLRPIAGLLHHGSGPRFTDLLDPEFPMKLAQYAAQVAAAFPDLRDYTPVNEPLTTARFSALYGHWYPHARDTGAFLRALVNQCRAIQLAMRAIRRVRPHARLIQTEDIGSARSTPALQYQADYENDRRYLGFDLLCGRVDRRHPLYAHLQEHGVGDDVLAPFLDDPCPPDIIGVNYYLTSDRYLDEELARHPDWSHGGNGRHAYADIDAGRVDGLGLIGHEQVLRGVWERFQIPVALTELHVGCTREEQLRWYAEGWRAACALRDQGIPVEAVTSWALLGSYDWNSLVCTEAGVYETGAFDLRGAQPRPTAIAHMVSSLARSGDYQHPLLSSPGWWHRKSRRQTKMASAPRPILITGGAGYLARALVEACEARGLHCIALNRAQLDVTRYAALRDALRTLQPWALINAAGRAELQCCERNPGHSQQVHGRAPIVMAEVCKAAGVRFLTFSSNHVFGGEKRSPYLETDAVRPQSSYGQYQAHAERCLLELNRDAFVVRTCALFGRAGDGDPLMTALSALMRAEGELPQPLADVCSPTFVPHLAHACLDLSIDGAFGRWHLVNVGEESWSGLLQRLTSALGLELPQAGLASEAAMEAGYTALGSVHGIHMPTLEVALDAYLRDESLLARAASGAL